MLKLLLFLFIFLSAFTSSDTFSEVGEVSSELEIAVAEAVNFEVTFDLESAGEQEIKLLDVLRDHAVFKTISHFSSINLQLKSDVLYTFHLGNQPFFGASQNQILIPYTFVYQAYDYVRDKYPQQDELSNTLFAFTIEKLLWLELGRELINQYSLSITGEEEISLDQFSTLMLINLNEWDSEYLLDATEAFLIVDDSSTLLSRISFQSEAQLDELRYRLVMCMVLGKDYNKQDVQLDELTWDQGRLLHCRDHYQEKMMAWYDALKQFLKPENSLKKWISFLPKTTTDISAKSHVQEMRGAKSLDD
jgi:hypothetical protein